MPQFLPQAERRPVPGQAIPVTGPGVSNAPNEAFGRMGQAVEGLALDAIAQQTAEQRRLEQVAEDANKARGLAAMGTAKVRLHDSMRSLSDRILRGEVDGVAALGEWNDTQSQITGELTKDLPGHIAERVGTQIKLDASELASTGIGRAVETRQREVTRADLSTSLEGFERDALTDRTKAVTLAGAAITTLGASAGYGPDDQQRLLQGFKEKTAANMAEQRLLASSRNPAALDAFEQQLRGEDFTDLSPNQREHFEVRIENKRAALQHAAEVQQRRLEAARNRRLTEAEHAVRAVESIVDGGGIADDATLAKAQAAATGTPWADTANGDPMDLILRGHDAVASGRIKKDDELTRGERMKLSRELDAVPWATPKARDAAIDAASLIMDGLRDQRSTGTASSSDRKKAMLLALGGEIVDHGDGKTVAPPGWTENRFRSALRKITAEDIARQAPGGLSLNGQALTPDALVKALPSARMVPLGPSRYALDLGGIVLGASRQPFVFTLGD
ncbi:hypothetical protein OSTOST_11600 [Ostertagia ostertagi]